MKQLPQSPLAPKQFPSILDVPGVELGVLAASLRYRGRPDLLFVHCVAGTVAAGVFTKSKMPAAPVDWCQTALGRSGGVCRGLVVNAGNANAFTGAVGAKAARETAQAAATVLGCKAEEILIASTGVIGEPLDVAGFPGFLAAITRSDKLNWKDAATAITTTDTFPKGASYAASIDGAQIALGGIAKGSGMIAPDMATMLGFIFTNANIGAECLQAILRDCADRSFNSITVDSDTSTNDCVLAFATAQDANDEMITDPSDKRLDDFKEKLLLLSQDLAQQIVRDGEGAQKFVTVSVKGAEDEIAARVIAKAIANSPLVKTAIAGEDPNWGRIVMAVGKSGEEADRDALQLWIGGQKVASEGAVVPSYNEEHAAEHMRGSEIEIIVDVGIASGEATVWSCDLTHGYIDINADYRS